MHALQVAPHAHYGPAGPHPGHESCRLQPLETELGPDLRAGGPLMRGYIVLVGELAREEAARLGGGEFLGELYAAQEAPFLRTDQAYFGAQAPYEVFALLAHPVRHENSDGMAQGAPYGGEGDTGIPAGRFRYGRPRLQRPALGG